MATIKRQIRAGMAVSRRQRGLSLQPIGCTPAQSVTIY